MSIGEKLRAAREAAEMTPLAAAAMAERNGGKFGSLDILRWENDTHVPQLRNLTTLAYVYGVSLDEIVRDTDLANA